MPTDAIARKLPIMSQALNAAKAMTTIHAHEVQPGDTFMYNGHNRQITRVDRREGWSWPVAADDTGWAIALGRNLIEVRRPAA
jgi:hypothetical protein